MNSSLAESSTSPSASPSIAIRQSLHRRFRQQRHPGSHYRRQYPDHRRPRPQPARLLGRHHRRSRCDPQRPPRCHRRFQKQRIHCRHQQRQRAPDHRVDRDHHHHRRQHRDRLRCRRGGLRLRGRWSRRDLCLPCRTRRRGDRFLRKHIYCDVRRQSHPQGRFQGQYLHLRRGNGGYGFAGDGGSALSAQLSSPQGISVDSSGNLYLADRWNNRIR